jgi:hypothetical protein
MLVLRLENLYLLGLGYIFVTLIFLVVRNNFNDMNLSEMKLYETGKVTLKLGFPVVIMF